MSDYTKSTDFASKDTLPSGDSAKIVRGTEIDAEFEAIETAVNSKYDSNSTIAVANGGTGATTAGGARTNLGLVIGTNVQAWDSDLDSWSGKTAPSGTVVGTTDTQTLTNKTILGGAISSGTAVATTSGTSIDFTSIPSWVKRITVMFGGVSTNGTSRVQVQLGVSGTPETSGYGAVCGFVSTTNNTTRGGTLATGFPLSYAANDPLATTQGNIVLSLLGSNIWTCIGVIYDVANAGVQMVSGNKTLAGTLNMVRITTVNGTDTFDAGSINILYE